MNNLARALVCSLLIGTVSFAQSPEDKGAKSDVILDHIRQADLLNHILPILWTKEELNAVLPAIEKARQVVNTTHDAEYHTLLELDPMVTASIDKAINEGQVPGLDLLKNVNAKLTVLGQDRQIMGRQNENGVYDAISASLNVGQKKAMANDLDPASVTPGLKVESMTDEQKIRFYIRNILLDPLAYPLLVKLSRSNAISDK